MRVIEFGIPGLPVLQTGKMDWRARRRHDRSWKQLVWGALLESYRGGGVVRMERAHIAYTRYSAAIPDRDNLVASFKAVQDGLVEAGLLPSDAPTVVTAEYHHELCKRGEGRVTVRVEELPTPQQVCDEAHERIAEGR